MSNLSATQEVVLAIPPPRPTRGQLLRHTATQQVCDGTEPSEVRYHHHGVGFYPGSILGGPFFLPHSLDLTESLMSMHHCQHVIFILKHGDRFSPCFPPIFCFLLFSSFLNGAFFVFVFSPPMIGIFLPHFPVTLGGMHCIHVFCSDFLSVGFAGFGDFPS